MKKRFSTRVLVTTALLSAIAFVLMYLELPLPFLSTFLKIDASDVPAFLAGLAMGPVSAVAVLLIKNVLHLLVKGSDIFGLGQLANFIVGCALVLPSAFLYKKLHNRKGALLGMGIGIISMVVIALIANYYVLIPLYIKLFFGGDGQVLYGMEAEANSSISNISTYLMYSIVPFNLIKGVAEVLITFLLYKRLSPILHGHSKL